MTSAEAPASVDLLLFEVGDQVYGADATQVLRIDRREATTPTASLGILKDGRRALVVRGPAGEALVPVDAVRGIHRAHVADLRRPPGPARGDECAIGFWLDAGTPVVLVDLVRALHFQGRQ
jgi:chemotaxis signal transduction protein